MERIMSTRIDESVLNLINRIVKEKNLSRKRIIEEAIRDFWQKIHAGKKIDPFEDSFGAWKRDESAEETVRKSRSAFNQSMQRHHVREG